MKKDEQPVGFGEAGHESGGFPLKNRKDNVLKL